MSSLIAFVVPPSGPLIMNPHCSQSIASSPRTNNSHFADGAATLEPSADSNVPFLETCALGPQRAAFGGSWRRLLILVVTFNIFWPAAGKSLFTASARNNTPAAPTSLAATAVSSSQVNLTWVDNSSNETGFIVQSGPSSTGPWTQIASLGASSTSYANTGLSAGTTYYYRVYAYNAR